MKFIQSLALFLSAVLYTITPSANAQEQAIDSHTQAIIDILYAIDTPNLTRQAMLAAMVENGSELPPELVKEFATCMNNELSDEMLYDMFIPIYKANLDQNTAVKLADFFNSETGKKFAIFVRVQAGQDLPIPNMTEEDMQIYKQYENDILKMGSNQLVADAEAAGEELGLQLAMSCISSLELE